jgi:acyl carrier protein
MNEQEKIWGEITKYLANESDICKDPSSITENMDIKNDLNFDSLQAAMMLMDLEDQFKIGVDTNLANIKTVGDVYKLVLNARETVIK